MPDQDETNLQYQLGRISAEIGNLTGSVQQISQVQQQHTKILHGMAKDVSATKARGDDHTGRIKVIEEAHEAHNSWRHRVVGIYVGIATLLAAAATAYGLTR